MQSRLNMSPKNIRIMLRVQTLGIGLSNRNPFPQILSLITLTQNCQERANRTGGRGDTNLSIHFPTFLLPCTPSLSRSFKWPLRSPRNRVNSAIGPALIWFASSAWKLDIWFALSFMACQIVAMPSVANSGVLKGTSRVLDIF
jgi:hypothetical protein